MLLGAIEYKEDWDNEEEDKKNRQHEVVVFEWLAPEMNGMVLPWRSSRILSP